MLTCRRHFFIINQKLTDRDNICYFLNIALISRGYQSDLERKNDLFIHDFLELLNVEKIDYQIPALDEDKIRQALVKTPIGVDEDFIVSFVLNGYRLLINIKI